jgi:ectoine hydroxylase-related dioxygenase (phytanoyl-CoA dioxygenase family)
MSKAYNEFKKNGYYVAKGLINPTIIKNTIDSLNKTVMSQVNLISGSKDSDKNDIFTNLKKLFKGDINRYKKIVGELWRKESVYSLTNSTSITEFLKDEFYWEDLFVPGGQVVHIMAEELKIPDGYFGLVPHQDFPSVQGSLNGAVVWIPLVNVDKNNFPLEVIPRSHLRGLAPMISHGASTWEVDPKWYDQNQFLPVEVNVGDVIFMSMFTIHRSSKNGTLGSFRLAISTRFDDANEPTFIERSFPTAYIRSVRREQFLENFPSLKMVEKVFKIDD